MKGKLIQGLSGCQQLWRGEMLYQRLRCPDRQRGVALLHHCAHGRARRRHLGRPSRRSRVGAETWITGSYDPDLNLTYWGTAQAKPWMRVEPRIGQRCDSVRQLDAGAECGYRKTKMVFRPCSRRNTRLGRSLRARARGRSRPELCLQRRQDRHPVEAGPQDRQSISVTRKWCSRMCTIPSIPPRASRITATTSWNSASAKGCWAALPPKAATTGTP